MSTEHRGAEHGPTDTRGPTNKLTNERSAYPLAELVGALCVFPLAPGGVRRKKTTPLCMQCHKCKKNDSLLWIALAARGTCDPVLAAADCWRTTAIRSARRLLVAVRSSGVNFFIRINGR